MVERHYAPNALLLAFDGHDRERTARQIASLVGEGERVGLVAFDIDGARATSATRMPRDAAGYARTLYAALHLLDQNDCRVAFVERIPQGSEWEAIADRLRRAGLRVQPHNAGAGPSAGG